MNNIEYIKKHFTIKKYDDVLFKICFGVVLFFKHKDGIEHKKKIISILEDYIKLFPDDIRWTRNPKTGTWKKIKSYTDYITPKEWLLEENTDSWEFVYHGGEKKSDASDIKIQALHATSSPAIENLGYIYALFPIDFLVHEIVQLKKIIYEWCNEISPYHGYGGFWLSVAQDKEHQQDISSGEFDVALRFPGININNFPIHCISLMKGIKCVDWINIISTEILEKIGGVTTIKTKLQEFPIVEYNNGAVIYAGSTPQIGDTENNIFIKEYKDVAEILEPLRVKDHPGIHSNFIHASRILNDVNYRRWLARFSPQEESL